MSKEKNLAIAGGLLLLVLSVVLFASNYNPSLQEGTSVDYESLDGAIGHLLNIGSTDCKPTSSKQCLGEAIQTLYTSTSTTGCNGKQREWRTV